MMRELLPGARTGAVRIPASKSQAHRLLIAAALSEGDCTLHCSGLSRDITATMDCLRALGAEIAVEGESLHISPIRTRPAGECLLRCGESGSTLRFLLPVVGALGVKAAFLREGRLPQRPLAPFDAALRAHGMALEEDGALLRCSGQLLGGEYSLPGNVSSQYISGLLLALPLLDGASRLSVTGKMESAAYVTMTEDAQRLAGIEIGKREQVYITQGPQRGKLPEVLDVEGDWSNAAFFLALGALSPEGVHVAGLNGASAQGDRAVLELLRGFGAVIGEDAAGIFIRRGALHARTIDAAPIPDLIPVLSVVAALAEGETRIVNAARLRLKESDRLATTAALLHGLGAEVEEQPEGLVIRGKPCLRGGEADAAGDHRIAMSAAVAASASAEPVRLSGAESVGKSYPRFWEDYDALERGAV